MVRLLTYKNVPQIKVPIWQYDSMFRTKEIISKDRARFARAWYRSFNNYGDRGGDDPEIAFKAWFDMIKNRYRKHIFRSNISKHPKFIVNRLESLKRISLDTVHSALKKIQNLIIFNFQENSKRNIFKYLK